MKFRKRILALFAAQALCGFIAGCASQTPAQQSDDALALNAVINGAVSYASGNDVGAAVDAIQGASYVVRSLQSTPAAASAPAVTAAVTTGGVPSTSTLPGAVANAVTVLTANGASPSAANETTAEALDKAVAVIASKSSLRSALSRRVAQTGGRQKERRFFAGVWELKPEAIGGQP